MNRYGLLENYEDIGLIELRNMIKQLFVEIRCET